MIERLVALVVLAATGVYLANGWSLPLGTTARPGPGFYPLAVGGFGAAVALAWVVSALRRARTVTTVGAGSLPVGPDLWRVGATAGLLVAFCLLLPLTGYPLAALLFAGLLLRGLGARWTTTLAVAIAGALGSYYLFGVLLGVPLPHGVFFD